MNAGFYWVRHAEGEDWEPALWNTVNWVFLGVEAGDEVPFEIGDPVTPP